MIALMAMLFVFQYMGLEFSQQHVIQYAVDVANIVDLVCLK